MANPSKPVFQNTLMIYIAFLNAVVIYGILAYFLSKPSQLELSNAPESSDHFLKFIFLFISISIACGSWVVKRILTSSTQQPLPAQITVWAMCETPAVMGLILIVTTKAQIIYFYPFAVISMLTLILHFPRKDEWESTPNNLKQGGF